jgi:hypothetical protein
MSHAVIADDRQIVRAGALAATCRIVRHEQTGDWVAIGAVDTSDPALRAAVHNPPLILAGVGPTAEAAINDLEGQLRRKAELLSQTVLAGV